jgi:hypothetical protein
MAAQETASIFRPGGASQRKGLRLIPAISALIVVVFSLYASQATQSRVNTPAAILENDKNGEGRALVSRAATLPSEAAQGVDGTDGRAAKAVAAAKKFLESLNDEQRTRALLDFASPKKAGWSNLPVTNVPRNGVRMGDLTQAQRDAALAVLAAVLSKNGYQKVVDIMYADEELATGKGKGKAKGGKGGKGGGKASFGIDNYFLAIFGEPSTTRPWFVQFGGHHLGVNVTVLERSFVLTPTHTGTQPASYMRDGKTVRPLGPENDNAFDLVNALDDTQRAQAVLGDRPGNLVLGPGQDGKTVQPRGIKGSALNAGQQAKLLALIGDWINIVNDDAAGPRMAEIKSNLADTYFAWSGPTTRGSAAYFRIQGPTLVIEYAPQGGIDHIHTVLRDPTNDYGQKLLKR